MFTKGIPKAFCACMLSKDIFQTNGHVDTSLSAQLPVMQEKNIKERRRCYFSRLFWILLKAVLNYNLVALLVHKMLPEHQGKVKTEIAKGLPDIFKLSHIAFREHKKDLTLFWYKIFVRFMTYN